MGERDREGLRLEIGGMENVFYELIKMDFFIWDDQDIRFRKPAEKGPGFKSRRIVIIRVQGAVDLVQMLMT
jgi:hypothetical protein